MVVYNDANSFIYVGMGEIVLLSYQNVYANTYNTIPRNIYTFLCFLGIVACLFDYAVVLLNRTCQFASLWKLSTEIRRVVYTVSVIRLSFMVYVLSLSSVVHVLWGFFVQKDQPTRDSLMLSMYNNTSCLFYIIAFITLCVNKTFLYWLAVMICLRIVSLRSVRGTAFETLWWFFAVVL